MIICIGREFGSGGHEIGRKVAEKLGLELYDRDLIDRAAEKIIAMPKDVLEKADEKKRNPWLHEVWYDVPNQELNGMTANDALHLAYNSIIRELAEKGDCVFVGRCADYILREHPRCANVFISASKEDRITRLCAMHHIDAEAAEEMIEKADKRRSEYYNYYSYKTWGAAATYHLCVDSSSLGVEETVRFIEEFVVKKLQLIL